jgi:hypothetical protein
MEKNLGGKTGRVEKSWINCPSRENERKARLCMVM